MATTKPRITITLNQHTYDVLRVISECGGQPMSSFVSELLDSSRPTLERMAVTFKTIKEAQEAERLKFLKSVDSAQAALEPVVAQMLGQFDLFLGVVEQAAGGGGLTARGEALPPAAEPSSPPTNRGDTPTKATTRKPSSRKASGRVSASEVPKKTRG